MTTLHVIAISQKTLVETIFVALGVGRSRACHGQTSAAKSIAIVAGIVCGFKKFSRTHCSSTHHNSYSFFTVSDMAEARPKAWLEVRVPTEVVSANCVKPILWAVLCEDTSLQWSEGGYS